MVKIRLSRQAEAELDRIWVHVADASGSVDIANRVTDLITERLWLLAQYPYLGRRRNDLLAGTRSFPADDYLIIYRITEDEVVLILHVFHGSRDIASLFDR